MKIEHSIQGVRAALKQARKAGKSVAFVPTMGNLHSGHISLVAEAKRRADYVVTSIFVNPTQFGANEDFSSYPRTLDNDAGLLAEAGCNLLFAPSAEEMYPDGRQQATTVQVAEITDRLCGASRPGHFTGVATVVTKLLNIIQPEMALFGEKDYQQLAVIRRLVAELCIPTTIIGMPTQRAEDGLALSSRNGFLTEAERAQAPLIYQTLRQLQTAIQSGQRDYLSLASAAKAHLTKCGFAPDYVEICAQTLDAPETQDTELVILVAARLGKTRLIDNLAFSVA